MIEVEAKYRVRHPMALRRRLRALGFSVAAARKHEVNWLFTAPKGCVLRLRRSGHGSPHAWLLTAKGPRQPGSLKRREEQETPVGDGRACRRALELAGHRLTLEYRRHRTVFQRAGERGEVAWDETPFGVYLELEGPAAWIARTARALELTAAELEPRSYAEIYSSGNC